MASGLWTSRGYILRYFYDIDIPETPHGAIFTMFKSQNTTKKGVKKSVDISDEIHNALIIS